MSNEIDKLEDLTRIEYLNFIRKTIKDFVSVSEGGGDYEDRTKRMKVYSDLISNYYKATVSPEFED